MSSDGDVYDENVHAMDGQYVPKRKTSVVTLCRRKEVIVPKCFSEMPTTKEDEPLEEEEEKEPEPVEVEETPVTEEEPEEEVPVEKDMRLPDALRKGVKVVQQMNETSVKVGGMLQQLDDLSDDLITEGKRREPPKNETVQSLLNPDKYQLQCSMSDLVNIERNICHMIMNDVHSSTSSATGKLLKEQDETQLKQWDETVLFVSTLLQSSSDISKVKLQGMLASVREMKRQYDIIREHEEEQVRNNTRLKELAFENNNKAIKIEELKALVLEKTTYLTESANGQKAGLTIEVMKAMFEKEIRDNIATLQIELAEVVDRLDVSDESFSKMQEEMAGERQVFLKEYNAAVLAFTQQQQDIGTVADHDIATSNALPTSGNVKPHEVLKLINEYKADNCQLEKDNQELTSSIDHMSNEMRRLTQRNQENKLLLNQLLCETAHFEMEKQKNYVNDVKRGVCVGEERISEIDIEMERLTIQMEQTQKRIVEEEVNRKQRAAEAKQKALDAEEAMRKKALADDDGCDDDDDGHSKSKIPQLRYKKEILLEDFVPTLVAREDIAFAQGIGNALWSAMSHGASKPKEEQLVATPLTPKATTPKSGKRVKRGKSAMAGKKEEEELDQLKVPVVKSPRLSIANGGALLPVTSPVAVISPARKVSMFKDYVPLQVLQTPEPMPEIVEKPKSPAANWKQQKNPDDDYNFSQDFGLTVAQEQISRLSEMLRPPQAVRNQTEHINSLVGEITSLQFQMFSANKDAKQLGILKDTLTKALRRTQAQRDVLRKRCLVTLNGKDGLPLRLCPNEIEIEKLREKVNSLNLEAGNWELKFKQRKPRQSKWKTVHDFSKVIGNNQYDIGVNVLENGPQTTAPVGTRGTMVTGEERLSSQESVRNIRSASSSKRPVRQRSLDEETEGLISLLMSGNSLVPPQVTIPAVPPKKYGLDGNSDVLRQGDNVMYPGGLGDQPRVSKSYDAYEARDPLLKPRTSTSVGYQQDNVSDDMISEWRDSCAFDGADGNEASRPSSEASGPPSGQEFDQPVATAMTSTEGTEGSTQDLDRAAIGKTEDNEGEGMPDVGVYIKDTAAADDSPVISSNIDNNPVPVEEPVMDTCVSTVSKKHIGGSGRFTSKTVGIADVPSSVTITSSPITVGGKKGRRIIVGKPPVIRKGDVLAAEEVDVLSLFRFPSLVQRPVPSNDDDAVDGDGSLIAHVPHLPLQSAPSYLKSKGTHRRRKNKGHTTESSHGEVIMSDSDGPTGVAMAPTVDEPVTNTFNYQPRPSQLEKLTAVGNKMHGPGAASPLKATRRRWVSYQTADSSPRMHTTNAYGDEGGWDELDQPEKTGDGATLIGLSEGSITSPAALTPRRPPRHQTYRPPSSPSTEGALQSQGCFKREKRQRQVHLRFADTVLSDDIEGLSSSDPQGNSASEVDQEGGDDGSSMTYSTRTSDSRQSRQFSSGNSNSRNPTRKKRLKNKDKGKVGNPQFLGVRNEHRTHATLPGSKLEPFKLEPPQLIHINTPNVPPPSKYMGNIAVPKLQSLKELDNVFRFLLEEKSGDVAASDAACDDSRYYMNAPSGPPINLLEPHKKSEASHLFYSSGVSPQMGNEIINTFTGKGVDVGDAMAVGSSVSISEIESEDEDEDISSSMPVISMLPAAMLSADSTSNGHIPTTSFPQQWAALPTATPTSNCMSTIYELSQRSLPSELHMPTQTHMPQQLALSKANTRHPADMKLLRQANLRHQRELMRQEWMQQLIHQSADSHTLSSYDCVPSLWGQVTGAAVRDERERRTDSRNRKQRAMMLELMMNRDASAGSVSAQPVLANDPYPWENKQQQQQEQEIVPDVNTVVTADPKVEKHSGRGAVKLYSIWGKEKKKPSLRSCVQFDNDGNDSSDPEEEQDDFTDDTGSSNVTVAKGAAAEENETVGGKYQVHRVTDLYMQLVQPETIPLKEELTTVANKGSGTSTSKLRQQQYQEEVLAIESKEKDTLQVGHGVLCYDAAAHALSSVVDDLNTPRRGLGMQQTMPMLGNFPKNAALNRVHGSDVMGDGDGSSRQQGGGGKDAIGETTARSPSTTTMASVTKPPTHVSPWVTKISKGSQQSQSLSSPPQPPAKAVSLDPLSDFPSSPTTPVTVATSSLTGLQYTLQAPTSPSNRPVLQPLTHTPTSGHKPSNPRTPNRRIGSSDKRVSTSHSLMRYKQMTDEEALEDSDEGSVEYV